MNVEHPLLDDAEAHTEEELHAMAVLAADWQEKDTSDPLDSALRAAARVNLILALRSCLRNNVGRYMYYWKDARRFKDEMISEGLLALTLLMNDLTHDFLSDRNILTIASRRIQYSIEEFLNNNLAASSPGMSKQRSLLREGNEPLYHVGNDIADVPESFQPAEVGDEWKRDALQILNGLAEDSIDEAILDRYNWGRTHQELAEELGVSISTINRHKAKLLERYLAR